MLPPSVDVLNVYCITQLQRVTVFVTDLYRTNPQYHVLLHDETPWKGKAK